MKQHTTALGLQVSREEPTTEQVNLFWCPEGIVDGCSHWTAKYMWSSESGNIAQKQRRCVDAIMLRLSSQPQAVSHILNESFSFSPKWQFS